MFILFGGSFDPVHIGHLIVARDVREKLQADKVVFLPAYRAPLKEEHRASPEDRLNMLKLAIEGEEGFDIEDYELKKGGISYTVETLEYLYPKVGEKPFLILGADSVLKFHLWKEPERVLELSKIIVVDREGKIGEVRDYIGENFPWLSEGEDFLMLSVRRIDVSATEIRSRVREGKSIYCLVPDRVRRYIEERGLYR
ncbi:nicotinate-nucleotide adenylyltransferase [Hydrogenivirga caldilitoris]|uniref:Probable nicotinate-nucleotide adenylyltransferase n=1 Tax=Hydrogenivirga caldilitoris TaxID=246264 RepID=A0A497XP75_9AQUI|nr:nicotinate (nicotinamide) nucleotide adenylyltransferase [Hydrogenivirga caldilitoris]RLJ70071.1 nicotinate-nucleotide adenylyltransferase [Hydrogenivirga caldilitoris]